MPWAPRGFRRPALPSGGGPAGRRPGGADVKCREIDENAEPGSAGRHPDGGDPIEDLEELFRLGLLPRSGLGRLRPVVGRYPLRISRYYAGLIKAGDPRCPIALQCLPRPEELAAPLPGGGFAADPLGDVRYSPAAGLTLRYPDRALLHATSACAVRCRFCFRKNLTSAGPAGLFAGGPEAALELVSRRAGIRELILSGGDPLMLAAAALEGLLRRIARIGQVRRIRIHTRVPVTDPARVSPRLVRILATAGRPCRVVTHFNHPRELTVAAASACGRLRAAGVAVLNQNVLLRGVNDRVSVLESLYAGLSDLGIRPYYLHHPDRALGTAHFHVEPGRGLEIHRALRRRLPRGACPPYVIDLAGPDGKRPVAEVFAPSSRSAPPCARFPACG